MQWLLKFRPELPLWYDGMADPAEFLWVYVEVIWAAGGNDKVMANWHPMALMGVSRSWLLSLPESLVSSWEELCDLFITHFVAPAPHAVAAIFGRSQAPASSRHIKQLFW